MQKDLFNGKIKREYVSYMIATLGVAVIVPGGMGIFFVLTAIVLMENNPMDVRILLFVMGIICILAGIVLPLLMIFVIRKYPKYEKLRKHVLNSDYYFVDVKDRDFRGHRKSQALFEVTTRVADREKRQNPNKIQKSEKL